MKTPILRTIIVFLSLCCGTVFADEALKELRVLSYNIHICIGNDGKLDAERIAKTIMAQKPDLVALQEVDRNTNRVKNMDQVAELAKLTGMNVVFGKTISLPGGDYGIALMSRFPIKDHKTHLLPQLEKQEDRVALEATIQLDEKTDLRFVSTHFCHRSEERRIKQAQKINELFTGDDRLTILCGDINTTPESKTLAVFNEKWTDTTNREPTFPGSKAKIDYIFYRPAGAFRVKETKVIPEKVASDHYPVLSVLEPTAPVTFEMHRIGKARTEACGVADFNGDGRLDVVAGEFVYLAPDWKPVKIRSIQTDVNEEGKGYARDFGNQPMDVDGDGFVDVIACDWFAKKSMWFRHPGKDFERAGLWSEHLIEQGDNYETIDFWDVTGNGKADDLVPAVRKTLWFEKTGNGKFAIHTVSDKAMTFGNGVGDVNGDGRPDLIRPNAWFEAPEDVRSGTWKEHPLSLFSDENEMKIKDMAQMYVLDVNGDGFGDILASAAHDYGLFWFEQVRNGTEITWKKHVIDKSWSQVHAVTLADLDGDGHAEIVAGKRFMAHNGGDRGEFEPLGIYWYKPKQNGNAVHWEKHVITYDQGIGAGMNLVAADLDGDGDLDIVTTGKYGGPVWFENKRIDRSPTP